MNAEAFASAEAVRLTPPPASPRVALAAAPPRSALVRLLQLCLQQRASCVQVLLCQVALLALGLLELGSTGLGIDYLRTRLQPGAPAVHWPLHLAPPQAWPPMTVLSVIAGVVVCSALLRGALTGLSGALLARLVHRNVVSGLQTTVFA